MIHVVNLITCADLVQQQSKLRMCPRAVTSTTNCPWFRKTKFTSVLIIIFCERGNITVYILGRFEESVWSSITHSGPNVITL